MTKQKEFNMRVFAAFGILLLLARLFYFFNDQLKIAIGLGSIGELLCFLAIFSFIFSAPCGGD